MQLNLLKAFCPPLDRDSAGRVCVCVCEAFLVACKLHLMAPSGQRGLCDSELLNTYSKSAVILNLSQRAGGFVRFF